jgi:hypothetical protein
MTCPFDSETLVNIVDMTEPDGLGKKIRDFKATLTEEQQLTFNAIDDIMVGRITEVQHETVKTLCCPVCPNRSRCK